MAKANNETKRTIIQSSSLEAFANFGKAMDDLCRRLKKNVMRRSWIIRDAKGSLMILDMEIASYE